MSLTSTGAPDAGAETASPLLEIRDITAGYGRTTVLRDVSFAVAPGTVTAVLGANGAGKTTLLRTASGLLRPSTGQVLLNGIDVTRRPPHKRAQLGLCSIPEGRGIFRTLTVRDNLRISLPPWRADDAIDAAVEAFPILAERLGQLAGSLSGGQQQMLSLARAYLAAPTIVLVDEVSMGLAPRLVDEIFASLRALAARGVALLVVEQYVQRALDLADQIVLLDHGTVSFTGGPESLDQDAVLRSYLGESLTS